MTAEQTMNKSRKLVLIDKIRECENARELRTVRFEVLKYGIELPMDREGYLEINRELAIADRFIKYQK